MGKEYEANEDDNVYTPINQMRKIIQKGYITMIGCEIEDANRTARRESREGNSGMGKGNKGPNVYTTVFRVF